MICQLPELLRRDRSKSVGDRQITATARGLFSPA